MRCSAVATTPASAAGTRGAFGVPAPAGRSSGARIAEEIGPHVVGRYNRPVGRHSVLLKSGKMAQTHQRSRRRAPTVRVRVEMQHLLEASSEKLMKVDMTG